MMPGTQFLTPTVHCPGCGELIDFHPEEWFRRMVKYCATCGTLKRERMASGPNRFRAVVPQLLRSAAPFKQLQKEDES